MKSERTKTQEIVDTIWGRGRYMVAEGDIENVASYLERLLSEVFAEDYVATIVKDLRGETLSSVERQIKFHAMRNLVVAGTRFADRPPDFLTEVDYSEDREWTLADVSEALFGQHGDMKIYTIDLPEAETGWYTTQEVRTILEELCEDGD